MDLRDGYEIKLLIADTTGSTTEQVTAYQDMLGLSRLEYLVGARGALPTTALSTLAQVVNFRLLQATDSTGGGATGITSATAVMGKAQGVTVGATCKAQEIYITFTTLASGATFSVGGYQWSYDSTADATARVLNSTGATGQGSVAMEAFATAFNSTANNPIATAWTCSTITGAQCVIRPTGIASTYLTATGTTLANVNIGKMTGYLSVEPCDLKDGFRYVALAIKSSGAAAPVTVFSLAEKETPPPTNLFLTAKAPKDSTARSV